MHHIKRVLVALDLTEIDQIVISYTSFLSSLLEVDTVYFFHVAKSLDLPKGLLDKYPNLIAPADESLEGLMKENVKQHFKADAEVKVEVLEGNPADKLLRWSDIKEIDLMVVGKKKELKGSGMLPGRLAKVGHCSILTVPEKAQVKLDRIIVPVDFSSSSKAALIEARYLAEKNNCQLFLQNTYVVPTGYHSSGKSYEEFASIMQQHSERDANDFMAREGLTKDTCSIVLSLDDDHEPADKIYLDAEVNGADMIVIGSKGRTGLASVLLGSVADKLLSMKGDIPVLVIKDKKRNLGFLEALLRI